MSPDPNCKPVNLTPGSSQTVSLEVRRNAGACLKVSWTNMTSAGLQIYLEGDTSVVGSLHMGETLRDDNTTNGVKRCFDVVSPLSHKLSKRSDLKCILRRGAKKVSASGAVTTVVGWTSDFNMTGNGTAYFILTNASKDMLKSKLRDVKLTLGSALVKSAKSGAMPPRQKQSKPVQNGFTHPSTRVHAMAAGPAYMLIDGRAIFDKGIQSSYLGDMAGASEIDAGFAMARIKDYSIFLIKDKTGKPDSAMIMKDRAGNGVVTTLGGPNMPALPSCGYEIPPTLTISENTKERLVFKVSGDMFDLSQQSMMRAVRSGQNCAMMQQLHVEHRSFEVFLPYGPNYDGKARIERAMPELQSY